MRSRFDQGEYWRQRGPGYVDEFSDMGPELRSVFAEQEATLRAALVDSGVTEARSVLEIGCGFGRVTAIVRSLMPDIDRYLALDISEGQIASARRYLGERDVELPEFQVADFRGRDLSETFDLVIVSEVFLHFPPDEIEAALHKAQRLAARFLVHIDPINAPSRSLYTKVHTALSLLRQRKALRWDWQHNFPQLYDNSLLGSVKLIPVAGGVQHIFVVERAEPTG
jgi:SAM-dependent methyltransferase